MHNFKRSVVLRRVHNLKRILYNAGLRGCRQILQQPKQFSNWKKWNYFYCYVVTRLIFTCYFFCFVLFVAIMTSSLEGDWEQFPALSSSYTLMDQYYHFLSSTILVSDKHSLIGKQVLVNLVTSLVAKATEQFYLIARKRSRHPLFS